MIILKSPYKLEVIMNRQIAFAFLLAVSCTAFAAGTEVAAELTETTNQNISVANSTENNKQETKTSMAQKAKNWMRNYLVRKDNKRTTLNVTSKAISAVGIGVLIWMNCKNLEQVSYQNSTKDIVCATASIALALPSIRELTSY